MAKILLVDDERAIRTLFSMVLESDGYTVELAESAAQAKTALQHDVYDVVITDLRMETPEAGFEVTHAAAACVPRPAIAILTAFPVPAASWRPSGADALFVKGGNIKQLLQLIQDLLAARPAFEAEANRKAV